MLFTGAPLLPDHAIGPAIREEREGCGKAPSAVGMFGGAGVPGGELTVRSSGVGAGDG